MAHQVIFTRTIREFKPNGDLNPLYNDSIGYSNTVVTKSGAKNGGNVAKQWRLLPIPAVHELLNFDAEVKEVKPDNVSDIVMSEYQITLDANDTAYEYTNPVVQSAQQVFDRFFSDLYRFVQSNNSQLTDEGIATDKDVFVELMTPQDKGDSSDITELKQFITKMCEKRKKNPLLFEFVISSLQKPASFASQDDKDNSTVENVLNGFFRFKNDKSAYLSRRFDMLQNYRAKYQQLQQSEEDTDLDFSDSADIEE